jgi:hypothetical protein
MEENNAETKDNVEPTAEDSTADEKEGSELQKRMAPSKSFELWQKRWTKLQKPCYELFLW